LSASRYCDTDSLAYTTPVSTSDAWIEAYVQYTERIEKHPIKKNSHHGASLVTVSTT